MLSFPTRVIASSYNFIIFLLKREDMDRNPNLEASLDCSESPRNIF